MKKVRKKDITAAVLSACVLIVADPFLQLGLVQTTATNDESNQIEIGTVTPDNIADILAQLSGSKVEIFGSAMEQQDQPIEMMPTDTEQSDGELQEPLAPDENEDTEVTESTDPETPAEEQEEKESVLTIEDKKDAVLKELTENGSYTFDWYGTEITITYSEYIYLCKLLHRETVGEDMKGRILVANVIFNRVVYQYFANDIVSVIKEPGQFSPVREGTVDSTVPDSMTMEAALYALAGVDYSEGALYFKMTTTYSQWFESSGIDVLFVHGAHTFYR